MKRAFHEHADVVVVQELRRVREEHRLSIALVCARVTAAVVEGVLEDARGEPRLAAALASIYGSDEHAPQATRGTTPARRGWRGSPGGSPSPEIR